MTCGAHLVIGAERLFEATGVASLLDFNAFNDDNNVRKFLRRAGLGF